MIAKLRVLLCLALVTPVLTFGAVAAQEVTTTTVNEEGTAATQEEDSAADRKERVEKRKETQKTKLSRSQETKLKGVCKAAQAKAGVANTKAQNLEQRDKKYAKIVERLTTLVTKLQAKGVDVSTLQGQITELQALITTFNTDRATYREDVSDIVGLDCVADPAGFKAAVDSARTNREKVANDAKAIKDYITNTIKPELQKIRQELAKTEGATTDQTNNDQEGN